MYAENLVYPKEVQSQVEWLVLWQRVGAGFTAGQQRELGQRVWAQLAPAGRRPARLNPQLEREGWRLLGSLERLDAGMRARAGRELLQRIKKDPRKESLLWALGRLGARSPVYGPVSSVVPAAEAEDWIARLLALRVLTGAAAEAVVELGALTDDPVRDISPAARMAAIESLRGAGVHGDVISALSDVRRTTADVSARAFREPLPEGLRLEAGPLAAVEPSPPSNY